MAHALGSLDTGAKFTGNLGENSRHIRLLAQRKASFERAAERLHPVHDDWERRVLKSRSASSVGASLVVVTHSHKVASHLNECWHLASGFVQV